MFKSAWVTSPKQISIIEKDFPPLSSRDVRVRVKACGICGTDIHFFREYPDGKPTPLGHEAVGVIEEIGSETSGLEKGDRVVVQNHITCGRCNACLNRRPEACTGIMTYMNDQAGMGEYLTVPESMVIKYDGLEAWEATVAEPLTVALDLCENADIRLNSEVLILGPGIIGLCSIKIAQKRGARNIIIAGRGFDTERGAARKKAAESLGADFTLDTSEKGWKAELKKQFPGGFDRVIITAPPVTIPDGIELAGFGADIIYNGISFSNDSVSFSANDLHFQKKNLITSHAIPNWGFPIALDMLKRGDISAPDLVTGRYPFEKIDEAFSEAQAIDKPVIKVVVEF
ncbi:MAG: alcohol dehydrogenase catalytic domain-containing protein [Spirochaetales bacterium]|nr:alcohol dehydrogenase catalytic domain-containing protein [Spirochaetales bacterium]